VRRAAGPVAIAVAAVLGLAGCGEEEAEGVAVTVPETLTATEAAGRAAFADRCAACHGGVAEGTAAGPPLVHPIYHPSHHADGAFWLAVRRGVVAHHWRFGDMPPQPGVSDAQVARIVAWVRRLQRESGIIE